MKFYIFLFLFIGLSVFADAQERSNFRFADVHNNDDRSGYSVFYPINSEKTYNGIVIFIHDRQNINPKAYGGVINHILKQNFLVIYPHYESFLINRSKFNLKYIKGVIDECLIDFKNTKSIRSGLPFVFIGHGTGAMLANELLVDSDIRNVRGVMMVSPAVSQKFSKLNYRDDTNLVIVQEENSKAFRSIDLSNQEKDSRLKGIEFVLHHSKDNQRVDRTSFRSFDERFSSENNGFRDYRIRRDKPNDEDVFYYYPLISRFLTCTIENKQCDYSTFDN